MPELAKLGRLAEWSAMEFIFTFQPESGYFLQTSKTRKWRTIGDKEILRQLENAEEENIEEFRCFSMASGGDNAGALVQNDHFRFDATKGQHRLKKFAKGNLDVSRSWLKNLYFVGKGGR